MPNVSPLPWANNPSDIPAPGSKVIGTPSRRSDPTVTDGDFFAPSPLDLEHDRGWQGTLAGWLGHITAAKELFAQPEYVTDLPAIVRRAADLVNDAARFVTDAMSAETCDVTLTDLMGSVGWFLAEAARVTGGGEKVGLWKKLTGHKPTVPVADCGAVLRELPVVLERCAALLGTRFRQQDATLQWLETSGTFLTELRHTLRWATRLASPSPSHSGA